MMGLLPKHTHMLQKLETIKVRFDQVQDMLSQPDVVSDMKRFTQLNREYKELQKIVEKYYHHDRKTLLINLTESRPFLSLLASLFFVLVFTNSR
jgi:peptide chain release factor 1